jgi:predicted DNA-binding transcriptional regulator AlpA
MEAPDYLTKTAAAISSLPSDELDSWIPAPRVAVHFGINRRTLARWLKNESLNFPRPEERNKRLYFRQSEIRAWENRRARLSTA